MEDSSDLEPKNTDTVFVIFGATGNLAQKKLIPALYHLLKSGHLSGNFTIVCAVRDEKVTLDSILEKVEIALLRQGKDADETVLKDLKEHMKLLVINSTKLSDYTKLRELLDNIDQEKIIRHNRLYYLAIPPNIFPVVVEYLAKSGLNDEQNGTKRRILVEKPFGSNLQTAHELVDMMNSYFKETQVYRIDHYLAKETAQNILAFRFHNPLIEGLWSNTHISHIQITTAETIDIEGRADFYDKMGALRDLIQSHLLQLISLATMEVPVPMDASTIHAEKLKLLSAIKPIDPNGVGDVAVRGQYRGYKTEVNNDQSYTETFAAIKLEITNSRWENVPILLRTGKALAGKMTEITVVFNDRANRGVAPNLLTIRIQPNEGISIQMKAKKPGFGDELQNVNMDFCYETAFDGAEPDAYERVLSDAIAGDQTLFATSAEVLKCWEIIEPILAEWQKNGDSLQDYEKGSWGPEAATELAQKNGYEWLSNTSHVCEFHPKG